MKATFTVSLATNDYATVVKLEKFLRDAIEFSARSEDSLDRFDLDCVDVLDITLQHEDRT